MGLRIRVLSPGIRRVSVEGIFDRYCMFVCTEVSVTVDWRGEEDGR